MFLGLVFALIFAHAPVIFPTILERCGAYGPSLYAHVLLLQGNLALRAPSRAQIPKSQDSPL